MRILFEEHQYRADEIAEEVKDICPLHDIEKKISISYVGYFYNPEIKDCVFILPKVLLKDEGDKEVVANIPKVKDDNGEERSVTPEDIVSPEGQQRCLTKEYRKFIYEFAVWIYRTLSVYRHQHPASNAIYYRPMPQEGSGKRQKTSTFLDVILSLIRFNRENQSFFLFTIKNLHSGNNKINWTRTINHSQCFIQGKETVYLDPVNKKRCINFEEELFVIFFSILNYLNENYGFNAPINCQYELIKGKRFAAYMNGMGKVRLKQIRYKYFSDKTLQMWDMCYAFFDSAYRIAVNVNQKEYLLAKSFEHVFEAMIDELIGENDIPKGLKEQRDGKRVDHIYTYDALTNDDEQRDQQIYYIGDSKYYKNGHKLGRESIYKQYTYARNVIQWNIDLFMDGGNQRKGWTDEEKKDYADDKEKYGKIRLRNDEQDPLTEGYNVIPNFFISAFVNENRSYVEKENIKPHDDNGDNTYISSQFDNRLFDRDTLILSHYDVNFLYVVYLYARNKSAEKTEWKRKVRDIFRKEIRKVIEEKYDFYAMKAKGNPLAGEQFIKDNFKDLQGKLYRPYDDKNTYLLALERKEDNAKSYTYSMLNDFFEIEKIDHLGTNPTPTLDEKVKTYQEEHPYTPTPNDWLPRYYLERYANEYFVIGSYHDQAHWDWITGKNDRGTLIYNVRLNASRSGTQVKSHIRKLKPRFAILYEEGHERENRYHVFRIHDYAEMTEDRMRKALYPREPKGEYFIFRFDEEISFGRLDIAAYISHCRQEQGNEFVASAPLYSKGEELMKYK